MGELKNTFSWSFSAAEDFEQCRRRRYWSKYGMWGGWGRNASPEQKAAYRLCKMDNRWGLMGQAAENAIMWVLKQHQQGVPVDATAGWEQVARPFLTRKWNESSEGSWRHSPKQFCCLREHYYKTMDDENAAKRQVAAQVQNCIENFIDKVLPRIGSISPGQEFRIATPEQGGDVEHFFYEGVKIYSIPDYAYTIGDEVHIHDWKAGKIKAEQHRLQLSLYALWAIVKHGATLDKIFLYVEYLNEGQVLPFQLTEEDMEETQSLMSDSVGEMTEYLVDCDRDKNEPLPKEEWELTFDPANCGQCNFYEFCRPELERLR
ncbi:MAG: PD-(D/E)XK nuclease family protein [Pontiellaceae bacterium]|nr:PD-(D/E)XK nuclease family protein [Pontiellaceae bacterium]MBN2785965.1 PD-(D/E)XK nuclease family protein [Pontiellaceae bacterium]